MSEFKWGTKKSRQAIIKAVDAWADEHEVSVLMIGAKAERSDFAPAIIGLAQHPAKPAVIYSINKLILCFMKANGWTEDEAWEWYSFNTERGLEYEKAEDNPPILITEIEDVIES